MRKPGVSVRGRMKGLIVGFQIMFDGLGEELEVGSLVCF